MGGDHIQDAGHRPWGPVVGGDQDHGRGLEREERQAGLGRDCLGVKGTMEGSRSPGAGGRAPSQRTGVSGQMDLRKGHGCGEQTGCPHTPGVAEE